MMMINKTTDYHQSQKESVTSLVLFSKGTLI